jgi:DNA gyrase subunit B
MKPDLDVFTDINVPLDYFKTVLKKQAVVNSGIVFKLFDEESGENYEYCYENGIVDYIKEISGEKGFTEVQFYETSTKGRDREDKPEYKVKMQIAFCFNNEINMLEYYHNSSFLEYGGAPDKAIKAAFVYEIDKCLKARNKYNKDESKITFTDIRTAWCGNQLISTIQA